MSTTVPLIQKLGSYGEQGLKTPIRGSDVGKLVNDYHSLVDLLPATFTPAIYEPNNDSIPLTHHRLKQFIVKEFDLTRFNIPWSGRVAISLPNGAELAVAVLSVASHWCAAPMNPASAWQEIRSELVSTRCLAIMVLSNDSSSEPALKAAADLGIGVIAISPLGNISGLFHMTLLAPVIAASINTDPILKTVKVVSEFNHPEIVLLLHTSGTSGNKKLVPYSLDMIIIGVGCIVSSWNLKPSDVCLNMMPLFHIGGIVRNLFSPILSGGAVITCPGFDPSLFWDVLYQGQKSDHDNYIESPHHHHISTTAKQQKSTPQVTWYYAAPTMHHAILDEANTRPALFPVHTIRFIANAAGALLPILADRLKSTFNATILTSYGMTECMPISTPPQNYALVPIGTSGTPSGPDILIVDDDLKVVEAGVQGNIFLRGANCFGGYESNRSSSQDESPTSSFFTLAAPHDGAGWFSTGDMGYLNSENYLFICGRSKEIINRGGETISPFEIEEIILQHPDVKEVMAFSAPHDLYQETVGVVLVMQIGKPRLDLLTLHIFLESRLQRVKWPQVIVFSSGLPQNMAGKILRIRYAERCSLLTITDEAPLINRLFESEHPPRGTALTTAIKMQPVTVDFELVKRFILSLKDDDNHAIVKEVLPVMVLLSSPHNESLVAFVVLNENANCTTMQSDLKLKFIRQACDMHLHAYQSPVFIYYTSHLPDDPIAAAKTLYAENNMSVLPHTPLEEQIETIWRTFLHSTTRLSIKTSFFDLGGDSLRAGQVISAMRKQLRVPLNVTDLFSAPTIERIAVKISGMKSNSTSTSSLSSYASRASTIPLSHSFAAVNCLMESSSPHTNHHVVSSVGQSKGSLFDDHDIENHSSEQSSILSSSDEYLTRDYSPESSNTSFMCLLIQAMPILVFFPLRRIILWLSIAGFWVYFISLGYPRFESLLAAMFLTNIFLGCIAPLVGIAAKWMIIGRYNAGKYPLWGYMYLKWWIVEQILHFCGQGIFRMDVPVIGMQLNWLYYTLMGAKIGNNVKIHRAAQLGQFDLLDIADNVALDACILRPFALEEGHFIMLPITIGANCTVGVKSIITPGAELPADTCLGPSTSSHEQELDHDPLFRSYCRPLYASPPWYLILFAGIPILLTVLAVSFLPWFFALKWMVGDAKGHGWYRNDITTIYEAFEWWVTPQRLVYYFVLRISRRCVIPVFQLILIILVKQTIIGKFTVMNKEERGQPWNCFRYWLMTKLLPAGEGFNGVATLVGTHYEIISIIHRMLGAKVGKRVYWPGSGLDIVEYDLLEVGDDVVFGSRSVVITTSTTQGSKKVILESGCMVADRCVLLPGTIVHQSAILGSGGLTAEDMDLPIGSVWLGSQLGQAIQVKAADTTTTVDSSTVKQHTITPFGKAFYGAGGEGEEGEEKVPFFVIPLWMIVVYNVLWQAFCSCYRNSPIVLSLLIMDRVFHFQPRSTGELFFIIFIIFSPLYLCHCLVALFIDIGGKWALLGHRQAGSYSWDKSSYCQRWQMYLTLQELRHNADQTGILDMITGSQYLVWYFQALGATIGANVCLFPNGGDPMFTEPDLVTVGDFAAIDDASVIAHLNTRGDFRLQKLSIGTGCVLKSMSRLLSGASMEAHSILQEHTLVMTGEVVETGLVCQGWPTRSQMELREYRLRVAQMLEKVNLQNLLRLRTHSIPSPSYRSSDILAGANRGLRNFRQRIYQAYHHGVEQHDDEESSLSPLKGGNSSL